MEKEKMTQLVTKMQAGEQEAASELYLACRDDLYYYILKTANDPHLAEDLLQDTFMEILQTIDKLNAPEAFVTWSRQIAYHRCTAYFRKRHELLADENEDGQTVFDTVEEDREEFIPDAALEKEDLKQIIAQMIADLPEDQRSALILRYYDELSLEEIAKVQNIPLGTVKSRLSYSRKMLKSAVESYEKKNGIKLHSVAILPLILWFFRQKAIAEGKSLTTKGAVAATAAAETVTTETAAAETTAAAAPAATGAKAAATMGAKVAAKGLTAKIVAGVLAASLVVGAGVVVANLSRDDEKEKPDSNVSDNKPTTGKHFAEGGTVAGSILQKSHDAYENPEIIDAYLTNDLSYICTTDKRIIHRNYNGAWEVVFDYSNLENVEEVLVLDIGYNEYTPAYFDTDGVLHVLCKDVWYSCPEVTETPYTCYASREYNIETGEYENICYVICYEKGKPITQYSYNEQGFIESYNYDYYTQENSAFADVSFVELQYSHTHKDEGGIWHHSRLYVAKGELFVECFDSRISLGIREEDLLTDLSHTEILFKSDDNTKIWKDDWQGNFQHPLPEGKTVDQITLAGTDRFATVLFFDDGSVYLYDMFNGDGQVPYYCEELTELYRSGRIKRVNCYFGIEIILDDNTPYSINTRRILFLPRQKNAQQEPSTDLMQKEY